MAPDLPESVCGEIPMGEVAGVLEVLAARAMATEDWGKEDISCRSLSLVAPPS